MLFKWNEVLAVFAFMDYRRQLTALKKVDLTTLSTLNSLAGEVRASRETEYLEQVKRLDNIKVIRELMCANGASLDDLTQPETAPVKPAFKRGSKGLSSKENTMHIALVTLAVGGVCSASYADILQTTNATDVPRTWLANDITKLVGKGYVRRSSTQRGVHTILKY